MRRALHLDRVPGEVAGRGPEPGRRLLRVRVPVAIDARAVRPVPDGDVVLPVGRERLLVRAARHADRPQHLLAHHVLERPPVHVGDEQLHDRVAAARIDPGGARHPERHDRIRVALPFQHADRARHLLARTVARKPVDRHARGVREQTTQRDLLRRRELVLRYLPARQPLVHVAIEVDPTALDQPQRGQRRDRLRDRGRLEQCARHHRTLRLGVCVAVPLRPLNAALVQHRDAHAGYVQLAHPLFDRGVLDRLAPDREQRRQPRLHTDDVLRDVVAHRFRRDVAPAGGRGDEKQGGNPGARHANPSLW